MAATGQLFLAVCFALLLTVGALNCYTKIEPNCSPAGPTCDVFKSSVGNVPMTNTTCDSSVTMCSLTTVSGTAQGIEFESAEAGCVPRAVGAGFTTGCYDRNDLEKIDPEEAEQLKLLEQLGGITFDSVEVCICNTNLCNNSVKSVFSISVIVWSVVAGSVLSI